MRLFIWTKDVPAKVRQSLSSVLGRNKDIPVDIGNQLPAYGMPQPTTILALGNEGREDLMARGLIPKNRTITSLRTQVIKLPVVQTPVMFSYSAGIHEIDYGKYVDLLADTAAAMRLCRTGSIEPLLGQYFYQYDLSQVIARIKEQYELTSKPVDTALDLETVGLDPYLLPKDTHPGAYIVTIQVSSEVGKSTVVPFYNRQDMLDWLAVPKNRNDLNWLLNTNMVSMRGANLKYDLHWIAVQCKEECTNFKFDTTLVGSLLDENRSNALDVHAKMYTAMGGYSDYFDRHVDKSRMDLAMALDPQSFIKYAGGDTDACLRVSIAEKAELIKDPQLTGFYVNILHPASRAFEMVERGGVLLDMDAFQHLSSEVNKEIDQLLIKGKAILGGRLVAKHRDLDKRGHLNLTKASLLIDFMFSPAGLNLTPKMFTEGSTDDDKTPSTSLEHLMMFKDDPRAKDFVGLMEAYGSATKTMSTYITGFLKHVRSDGRFHPSYYFFAGNKDEGEGGTNTGRTSCRDPAFQTIPKHTIWAKLIRRCYIAPPGYFILENDYSQGELRVIACVANELTMIQAYLNDMDLHSVTSGRFAGYTYEEMMKMKNSTDEALVKIFEDIRQLGKAGNFGLIYGMSAGGFDEYAYSNYGVRLPPGEAENFRNGFFDTYTALPAYHEEYKAHARLHGFVRSPLGRIRHLPLIKTPNRQYRAQAERQSINAPIQSTLSDMMIWAIALAKQKGWFVDTPCFGMVHDAKYTYIPQDNYLMYAKREQENMENLPFEKVGWKPQLKFVADGKFGLNMADLKKVVY